MSNPNLEIVSIASVDTIPYIAPGYCLATCQFSSKPTVQGAIYAGVVFKVYDEHCDPHTLIPELLKQFVHLMTLDDQKARGIFDIHPDMPIFFEDVSVLQIIEGSPRVV